MAAVGDVDALSLVSRVSPTVGKFDDIRPKAAQACLDRNMRLVEGVK